MTWTEHHRSSDGELLGYLDTDEHGTTPRTLFGAALAPATSAVQAQSVLEERGLSSLADRWWLTLPDGREFQVLILTAYPRRVVVARADYGVYDHQSERLELVAPGPWDLRPVG